MNKILVALGVLSASGAAFLAARQATIRLGQEVQASRAAWQAQTQLVTAAQTEQARLTAWVRELRQTLATNEVPAENALWSALQTNAVGLLKPELREHLLQELGFDWQASPDFIVVSKEALREFKLKPIQESRLAAPVAEAFAMTPAERERVEAAIERVGGEWNQWAAANTERSNPTNGVVAQYTLQNNRTLGLGLSNSLDAELVGALGEQRAELLRPALKRWADDTGLYLRDPETLILRSYMVGNEPRLKWWAGRLRDVPFVAATSWRDLAPCPFPGKFVASFPNGWADLAKRESFELPADFGGKLAAP